MKWIPFPGRYWLLSVTDRSSRRRRKKKEACRVVAVIRVKKMNRFVGKTNVGVLSSFGQKILLYTHQSLLLRNLFFPSFSTLSRKLCLLNYPNLTLQVLHSRMEHIYKRKKFSSSVTKKRTIYF